jgi:protein-tyrosine phosphatase
MIDLHAHILPEVDDGPRDMLEAVSMLRCAAAAGTTDIAATSHCNPEFPFDPAEMERRIAAVQAATGPAPRIHYGCELHLTIENIDRALASPSTWSIAHRGWLLVEFSDLLVPHTTTEILDRLIKGGLRPIIAHPERNPLLERRLQELESWTGMGCRVQVTANSLTGRFGGTARKTAERLLERGLVHILASDAHGIGDRSPALDSAWRHVETRYGAEAARRLFEENPRAMLEGAAVPPGEACRRRSWLSRMRENR